jgi:hypothetical protein
MNCQKDILISPVGMTLYNPPTSTNPYFEAIGSSVNLAKVPSQLKSINWNSAANDICLGRGELKSNKNFYTALASQAASQFKSTDAFDYIIMQLEANKKATECKWGVKRGRIAEVIRVVNRERKNWIDKNNTKQNLPTTSGVYALAPTSANLSKVPEQLKKINWQKAAEEICLGTGELAANKNFYINSARQNANANKSADVYTFIIDQLEANRTTTECKWGVKRGRIAAVIRVLKSEKNKWLSNQGLPTQGGDSTSDIVDEEKPFIERVIDTLFPPEQSPYMEEDLDDTAEKEDVNLTPYLIGGSILLGVGLIITFVITNKNKK